MIANIETITGGRDTLGVELQTRRARGMWLLHRQNGKWLISTICGMPTEKDSIILNASLETAKTLRPQIHAFVDTFEDALNSQDPSAVSAFFRSDADIIFLNSPLIHRTYAIQEWWRDYFSKPKPYRAVLIIEEIRSISDDVVQIDIISTETVQETKDKPQAIRQTCAMLIIVREANGWYIDALRVLPGKEDRIIRN